MLNKDAITRLREAAGLTMQQAANTAGMFVQQWQRVESGEIENPRLDTLESISKALGCEVSEIIKSEAKPKPKRKRGGK